MSNTATRLQKNPKMTYKGRQDQQQVEVQLTYRQRPKHQPRSMVHYKSGHRKVGRRNRRVQSLCVCGDRPEKWQGSTEDDMNNSKVVSRRPSAALELPRGFWSGHRHTVQRNSRLSVLGHISEPNASIMCISSSSFSAELEPNESYQTWWLVYLTKHCS